MRWYPRFWFRGIVRNGRIVAIAGIILILVFKIWDDENIDDDDDENDDHQDFDPPKTWCLRKMRARSVPVSQLPDDLWNVGLAAQGPRRTMSYENIFFHIYAKLGVTVSEACKIVPWLGLAYRGAPSAEDQHSMKNDEDSFEMHPYCPAVFGHWRTVSRAGRARFGDGHTPPATPPAEIVNGLSLNGYIHLTKEYSNGHLAMDSITELAYTEDLLENGRWKVEQMEEHGIKESSSSYAALFRAFLLSRYLARATLVDKQAVVIGTRSPMIEAWLLYREIGHVTMIEQKRITFESSRLSWLSPDALANAWATSDEESAESLSAGSSRGGNFDIAVSYSFVEHLGLGRSDGVIDPLLDLLETQKVWCLLKPKGFFLLGIPVGLDSVVWNARRIYGPIRLPLLTAGFEVIEVYDQAAAIPPSLNLTDNWIFEYPSSQFKMTALLLRKV